MRGFDAQRHGASRVRRQRVGVAQPHAHGDRLVARPRRRDARRVAADHFGFDARERLVHAESQLARRRGAAGGEARGERHFVRAVGERRGGNDRHDPLGHGHARGRVVHARAHDVASARDPSFEHRQPRARDARGVGERECERLDDRAGAREPRRESGEDRLGLELLRLGRAEPRLDFGVREVARLGEHGRSVAVAHDREVAGQQLLHLDPEVAHHGAVQVGAEVVRRSFVTEPVVGLRLVHVVAAGRVGVVVHRHEDVGGECVRQPRALGEVGLERTVGGREEVAVAIARHEHRCAARHQQLAQPQRDAEVHFGLAQSVDAHAAAEVPAVAGIDRDALALEQRGVGRGQAVLARDVARDGAAARRERRRRGQRERAGTRGRRSGRERRLRRTAAAGAEGGERRDERERTKRAERARPAIPAGGSVIGHARHRSRARVRAATLARASHRARTHPAAHEDPDASPGTWLLPAVPRACYLSALDYGPSCCPSRRAGRAVFVRAPRCRTGHFVPSHGGTS